MTEVASESGSAVGTAVSVPARALNDEFELSTMTWLTSIQLPLTPIGMSTNVTILTPTKTPWTVRNNTSPTKHQVRRRRPKDGAWKKPPLQFSTLMYIAMVNHQPPHLTAPQICNYVEDHFPYFQTTDSKWKIIIHSTLESTASFVKLVDSSCPFFWTASPDQVLASQDDIGKALQEQRERLTSSIAYPDELLRSPAFHTPYSPIEDYIPMVPVPIQQTDATSTAGRDEQPKLQGISHFIDSEDWKLPSDDLLTDSESSLVFDK